MTHKSYITGIALAAMSLATLASCEDQPDKFKLTSGKPEIKYVRVADPEKADSLLTSAYMDNLICIVGNNLTSVKKMLFNDKEAILNTSYITDHTLLVSVPSSIPDVVTNKIYMVTADGDTCHYDFKVLVPEPSVRSMSCEWVQPGNEATITGDYFIDDPNTPLEVIFPGNVQATEITSISKNKITLIVPDEATESGYLTVTSVYGSGQSVFQYHDTRNILFDWDGSHKGLRAGAGWRTGASIVHKPGDDSWDAIDGSYICFGPKTMLGQAGGTWEEDAYSFNYWCNTEPAVQPLSERTEFAELLGSYDLTDLQVKFECLVPATNPWSSSALQVIFTGSDVAANNSYFSDSTVPRGLWIPWQSAGSYDTAGQWVTVSLPLSSFVYTYEGNTCGNTLNKNMLSSLTMFVWNGGIEGTDCEPIICIDNIRVVPIE